VVQNDGNPHQTGRIQIGRIWPVSSLAVSPRTAPPQTISSPGARMSASTPLLARWCASISRTAWAMRAVHVIVPAGGAAFAGIVASVVLVPDSRGAWGAGLAVLMVAIAAVDARRFIIPDELTAAAAALGLAYAAVQDVEIWSQALAGALLRGLATAAVFWAVRAGYRRWRGREGIGLGDVKLAVAAGIWLDWPTIPIAVEIAAVTALGAYLVLHAGFGRTVRRTTRMPFGLFFAPAIWIAWIVETTLLFYSFSF
jgi:leader peptidase (prepilin peptidase) / N-methyltransferase